MKRQLPKNRKLILKDLQGAFRIEERAQEINLQAFPNGKEIAEYYSGLKWAQPNIPGGMIKKVVQAFERQLAPDALFISLDSAVENNNVWRHGQKADRSYGYTGSVAVYKDEDYGFAKFVLEKAGFSVRLMPVRKLTDTFVKPEDARNPKYQQDYDALLEGQVMMVVKMA